MTPEREALERLLTTAKLLQQNAEGCATNHYGHDCELNGLPGWLADTQKDIIAAQESLSAAPGEPCAVKPLEWIDEPNREPEYPAWNASNPFGLNYRIFKVWWGARDKWAFIYGSCFHHTIDEAKAAAQADYEKRIRSALVTTPQPAAGWDDLLRKIEYATRKDSLTDRERIQSIRSLVCAEISKSEVRREAPAPAATPHGKGSDAASVAIPVASSDLLVSQEAPVLSEPSPPADRREIVARKLMGFDGHQPWELTEEKQQQYFARADVILAALDGGR